ncbi:diaminopimelate dehydrogenase [Candidatus Saccharibacteria bacterium]|nr:diaminopimelate dehydrogenase [Candidatus Saccharibacteria bacterium]
MSKDRIRIGICGYGNLGRGVEIGLKSNPDMELAAIFSRRNNLKIESNVPVINISEVDKWQDKIDVMILCGGSAKDLPQQGPEIAKLFNTVDSFDTHANIPKYYKSMEEAARAGDNLSIISTGWDPGLFSIQRVLSEAILPRGETYTFWGEGVSQGHSDAVRRVPGVKNAVQHTRPRAEAIDRVRAGENPELSTREKHTRECFVVLEDNANPEQVEEAIKTMPNYFADYDTTVHFISEGELQNNHASLPHGGFVIRGAKTGADSQQSMEFSLHLKSNPEFTAAVLIAYARACYRLYKEGQTGAKTVLDIPIGLLHPKSRQELLESGII